MPSRRDDDFSSDRLTNAPTMSADDTLSQALASNRFTPGSIVAGRYRLIALLGRGGMGEVYRADDLTLDQPVALKFLTEGVAANDGRLAQFHNELRVARTVSHKNVCRLYDLGDADGRRFLTMEYVDGEDLSSSLRRFGRIPPDKAIQIARQLCAGVSAAHERGVLHRDLKPANVMIDGNGDVRITDFGIAIAAADAGAGLAGTPQYMAPELLAGKPATTKSDIYALGLILFEIFTGKRAYDAKTLGDLKQLHETATVTTPSSIVPDLEPAVEHVILRCLEKDPERRPASALTVAAALPGGDPLAAALAAGETPSPELLVAAGESQAMPVGPALSMAGAFLIVLLVSVLAVSRGSVASLVPMALPPDALADRADQILRKLGYVNDSVDRARGFTFSDYLQWQRRNGPSEWWNQIRAGRPPALMFWYRTSPQEFAPPSPGGRVDSGDPPVNVPGMHQLFLDTEGRLVEFHTVPPQFPAEGGASAAPWPLLFEAADLDAKAFTPVAPRWTPRDYGDAAAAWEGFVPGRPDLSVRLEAASFHNQLVSFQIVWPWTEPTGIEKSRRTGLQRLGDLLSVGLWVTMLIGGVLLARYNLRANRADRSGSARFAIGIMLATLTSILLSATHVANAKVENQQIMGSIAFASLTGGITWIFYLAIEPYARRFWPDALLGWTRMMSGRLNDPRVGRDLLIGLACGAAGMLLDTSKLIPMALGWRIPQLPFGNGLQYLIGVPPLLARWLSEVINALQSALVVAMIFLVMRLLLKRTRPAIGAGLFVLVLAMNGGSVLSGTWMDTFNNIAFTVFLTIVIQRFGLLAMATALFVDNIVTSVPMTTNLSAWWSTPTTLSVAMLIGLTGFAYRAARARQPLFGPVFGD